ncbi:MAG: mechanosensitive ion channel protein MscS, partial [Alphaproteobacteria bacterium]
MNLNTILDPDRLRQWLDAALLWLEVHLLAVDNLVQLGVIVATFIAARFLSPRLEAVLDRRPDQGWYARFGAPVAAALKPVARPVLWLAALWFAVFAAKGAAWPHHLMEAAVSLLTAWAVIRLASGLIRNPFWARAIAVTAWTIAALNLLGLLDPAMRTLDDMALNLGEFRLSVLGLIKAVLLSALFLYLASVTSRIAETRINASDSLTPSMRVLFGKFARVFLYALAIALALESVGINLAVFAVFGGALGL